MNKILSAVCILATMSVGAPNSVSAGEECVFRPVVVQFSRSVFLQTTKVFCRELPEDPVDQIAQAQATLTLCRDMGGTQEVCKQALLDSAGSPNVLEFIGATMDREQGEDDSASSSHSESGPWMRITRLNPTPPIAK